MKRINLKKKKHLRMQVLFLAPRTGLEPVTSQSAVMLPFAVPGKRRGIRRSVSPTAALRRSPFLCHRQRELSSPPTGLSRNIAVQMLVWLVRSSIRNSTREMQVLFWLPLLGLNQRHHD